MENQFENFESFLKEQVNGYRMYPSGKVWVKVHDHLHGKRRFSIGAVIALLLVSSLLFLAENINRRSGARNENTFAGNYSGFNLTQNKEQNRFVSNIQVVATIPASEVASKPDDLTNSPETAIRDPQHHYSQNFQTPKTVTLHPANREKSDKQPAAAEKQNLTESAFIINAQKKSIWEQEIAIPPTEGAEKHLQQSEQLNMKAETEFYAIDQALEKTNPGQIKFVTAKLNDALTNRILSETDPSIYLNSNRKKIRVQYYATPSISYRSLFDSRQKNNNISTGGVSDLDKSVFHKPAMGLEAGVNWLFSMDNRLRIKSGLQFNYNRYNIKATSAQPEISTIALFGSARDITSVSTLRNDVGFYPKWIENSNLQFSVPVGLEFTLANGKNVQLTLGSSIQPSLLLKNKMYLLSTDLKNYMLEPSLVRRFNFNGNIETFITINTKNARWHLGPQLRYQILSTYEKKYPFKENLFDYGFKIGFSRPLK